MKLSEFTDLLRANSEKPFHLVLPGKSRVPVSFHITEVGHVTKRFIDCGGKLHFMQACLLQAWLGPDNDHRLYAGKMVRVLDLAKSRGVLPHDIDLEVEIEYEDVTISQYQVGSWAVVDSTVVLHLESKHTDCLAKESCLPSLPIADGVEALACCGPDCC